MFLLFLMFQLFTFIGFCFLVLVLHKLKLAGACRADKFLAQPVRTGTLGTKEHYPFFRLFSWGYNVPVSKPKKNIRNITKGVDRGKKMFDKFRELIEKKNGPETVQSPEIAYTT